MEVKTPVFWEESDSHTVGSNIHTYIFLFFFQGFQEGGGQASMRTEKIPMGRSCRSQQDSLGQMDTVCLPKDKGGLGIKDVNTFNLALLAKWKWHLFQHQGQLWAKVLESKYGGWRGLNEAPRINSEPYGGGI